VSAVAIALVMVVAPAIAFGGTASTGSASNLGAAAGLSAKTCHAKITSVTGLSVKDIYHWIVITGSCFGSKPTYVHVASPYNGTDTQNCGNSSSPPTLTIDSWGDTAPGRHAGFSAGRWVGPGACIYGDGIGLTFTAWTPTLIVIGHGFGSALGTLKQNSGAQWIMTKGAACAVEVFNPANEITPANFTMPAGTC
jgi:hypothetical protein